MTSSDRSRSVLARLLAVGLSVAVPLGSLPRVNEAHADTKRTASDVESARQLYQEGSQLRDKGDVKGALQKFQAAHALGRTPITGLELARTHLALGQPVEAREICLDIARIPVTKEETARSVQARKDADALAETARAKMARLTVRVTGVADGHEPHVEVDGLALPAAALSAPRATNPGEHKIAARVADGPVSEASVTLAAGESKEVSLAVREPVVVTPPVTPPAATPTEAAPPPAAGMSPYVPIGGGILAVGAIVGSIFGAKALSANSDLEKSCTLGASRACPRSAQDTLDDGKTAGNVSTVAFVVAGVGAGLLIYGLVAKPRTTRSATTSIEPFVGLAGGGVHGRF